jgi:acyl-CoA synthetase (NDP forming)
VVTSRASLDTFFNPKSVAVIGASTTPGKLGYVAVENLIQLGYPGKIYPINPKADQIQGLKTYPNIKDVPGPIGVGLVLVPAEAVIPVLKECVEKGIKHAVIIAGGFSEVDEKGAKMQQEIADIARKSGMRIIGPIRRE